ncbi:dedicator of cytokinesis protein 7, partial [Eurytemora carolleeae]|uniref:dedicator of cytokinesis protein 7 n=1 Tax=Eurytemora carolleeae TaxID=1294199 RepID=UPI000C772EA7
MSSGNQRAFSTRIIREPAGNIRKHVAHTAGSSSNVMAGIGRTSVSSNRSRPMSSTSSSHTIVSESVGLEPIDYEEYVSNHSERDPLSQMLEFPPEDLEVNIVPRKIRTVQHVLPEEPYEELDPKVQNCVDCYTSDWVVVTRKYQQYSSSVTIRDRGEEKIHILNTIQKQEFEVDDTPDPSPQYPDAQKRSGKMRNFRRSSNSSETLLRGRLATASSKSSLLNSNESIIEYDTGSVKSEGFVSTSTKESQKRRNSLKTSSSLRRVQERAPNEEKERRLSFKNLRSTSEKHFRNVSIKKPKKVSWMLSQEDDRISIASTDSNSSFFEPYFKVDRCETPSNEIQEIFKSNVVTTKVKMKSTPFDESPLNIMTESFESDSTLVAQMDGETTPTFEDVVLRHRPEDSLAQKLQLISGKKQDENKSGSETPRGSWASFDLRTSKPDDLLPGLLDKVDPDLSEEENYKKRQENRPDALFSLYPEQDEFTMVERRSVADMPAEIQGHRILVKCLELSLSLQDVEPVFASMALYDAREKRKMSENFYFDMNSESVKKMLSGHVDYADISTYARSCVFDISSQPWDLFLVVKLEKVLQGDMNEAIEPYLKDDRNVEKVRATAMDACKRLGRYRMPFCWTAIELAKIFKGLAQETGSDVDSTGSNSLDRKSSASNMEAWKRVEKEKAGSLNRRGSLDRKEKRSSWAASESELTATLDNFPPVTLTVSSFFKQEGDKLKDDDLYKHLQDLKKAQPKLKQLKTIKGSLKLDICVAGDSIKHCLTPELAKLKPYPDPMARPSKEILNFPPKQNDSTQENPHYQFRNLVYVFPKELNFTNRSGERARNIAVKVQLMSGEGDEFALPVIFGKSNCPEFSREAFTAVAHHNKTPDFYEEVKIKLPSNLRDHHYLLFTFYHVTCKGQLRDGERLETPAGYTWIPILDDKGSLATGEHNLPVASELPSAGFSFISTEKAPPGSAFKWIDNKKCIFTVDIEAISSVHTENLNLDTFLTKTAGLQLGQKPARVADKDMEQDLIRCLRDVGESRPESLVAFMPLVLDKLLLLMVKPPTVAGLTLHVGQAAFSAMAEVVKVISTHLSHRNDLHGRNSLLSTFIQFQAHLPHLDPALSKQTQRNNKHRMFGGEGMNLISDAEVGQLMRNLNLQQSTIERGDLGNPMGIAVQGKLLHEQLALQLTLSKDSARNSALENSWFFFELMIKAMVEHLATTGTLGAPRKHRFSEQFHDDILNMVSSLTSDIIRKYKKDEKKTEQLNACLGFFLHDLLSVMDRGFVFSLIRTYMKEVSAKVADDPENTVPLWELQIEFLRIICSHEHFIPLNLPQYGPSDLTSGSSSPTPSLRSIDSAASLVSTMMGDRSSWAELSTEFRRQHFLVGLGLTNLYNALDQDNGDVHSKSVALLRNLLTCHDLDPRYSDMDCKARVANLYLPLVGIIIDNVGCLHGATELYNSRDEVTTPIIDQITAQQIAGSAMFGTVENMREPQSQQKPAKCNLAEDTSRHLLACFLWVVKNVEPGVLRQWWSELPGERLMSLCEVLRLTVSSFQYRGRQGFCGSASPLDIFPFSHCYNIYDSSKENTPTTPEKKFIMKEEGKRHYRKVGPQNSFRKASSEVKNHLEDMILGRSHAKEMMSRGSRKGPAPLSPNPDGKRWNRHSYSASGSAVQYSGSTRVPPDTLDAARTPQVWDTDLDLIIDGNLSTEISLVVLDTLAVVEQVVSQTDQSHTLLASVLRVILHALNTNQSTNLLQHLFSIQRSLVTKYPNLLFDETTEHCAALCKSLLKHCSSSISSIRSQASASLYLLMRQNFEIGNNFARVKMQVTMSLSSLVAEISSNFKFNEEHLRKSLKTILTYAETDSELSDSFNSFPEQVQDLVFNLHMILSDTVKMKEYLDDPEMHMDLMYRIAKGYQTSPDLRLTWLENMANKHIEHKNHAEAAMCKIHSAALVSEYLHMLEDRKYMPKGAVTFAQLTPNAIHESAVSDDIVSPDEEGICTGKNFTENGLIEFLEQAADNFTLGGMFEAVNEVYKSVLKVYEANRDFKKLAEIHRKLTK